MNALRPARDWYSAAIAWYALFFILVGANPSIQAQTREQKVRADRVRFELDGFWIYNDLPRAFEAAKKSGKPLLVTLRCIPCEECVKLDDDVVESNPELQTLLRQFVRVRVVSTNGLDLSLFQFDTDQSFTIFMLNADGTIYGRYGTRSDRTRWEDDVSVSGLAETLRGALELHREYPANRESLDGKRGKPLAFSSPEKFPALRERYTSSLATEGEIVKSCIHCHQVGDAIRSHELSSSGMLSPRVLYSYPHPKTIGMILDPEKRSTLKAVAPGSPAAEADLRSGDEITSINGQAILSMADVQWTLHQSDPEGDMLRMKVRRDGSMIDLSIPLVSGWREKEDLSWRASTWELRRTALGGVFLRPIDNRKREEQPLAENQMALIVEHVGQYSPHDLAKNAGVIKGDIVLSFGGRDDLMRETDAIAFGLNGIPSGMPVQLTLLRDGKTIQTQFIKP